MSSTITAATQPLATSATSTATAPMVMAPTMGAKAATKVSTASGPASGTPTITRPRPMSTASMRPTSAWVRMKLPRVDQARRSTSERWEPTPPPETWVSHGRKRWPSLMKKKVSTRVSTRLTSALVTALTPTSRPEAIELALDCSCDWAAATASSSWPSVTGRLLLSSWSRSLSRPFEALSAMSATCEPTEGAMKVTTPATTARAPMMTRPAARPPGTGVRRCSQCAAGASTVVTISARTIGSRMLHRYCTASPST